ncbi:alpha/beta fold hydrolase [Bauldia sp.]|uniref:S9 family peptidase n=1 Tax=Bauldia sp. TaxID=2575872 RepID=UPI003BAD0F8D
MLKIGFSLMLLLASASLFVKTEAEASGQESVAAPDVKEVIDVPQVSAPRISPDGSSVLYTTTRPDWDQNVYDSEVYVSVGGEAVKQVTDNSGASTSNAQWAADSNAFFYIADQGQGPQIYRHTLSDGSAVSLTAIPGGLLDYAVSPNGEQLALLLGEAPDAKFLARPEEMGSFTIVGENKPSAHLWILDIPAAIEKGGAGPGDTDVMRRLTGGSDFSVTLFSEAGIRPSFSFSPDGREIVFSHADSALILDSIRSDISIVDTSTGDIRHIVESEHWDETPVFSPDGKDILFGRTVIADWLGDKRLMIVPWDGGEAERLDIDRGQNVRDTQPLLIDWGLQGIDVFFIDGVDRQVHRIDPQTGVAARITSAPGHVLEFDASNDGNFVTYLGVDAKTAPEIYRLDLEDAESPERLSDTTNALKGWPSHNIEVVRWTADDGVQVEGVLYEPEGISAADTAPLIIVLHGGPRDVEYPRRVHDQLYPIEQWLAKGARVLFPNYRGSTGYGSAFRKLLVKNTGRAEMLDIEAAVEHFLSEGLADKDAIGVVGHSWGGYLSAFAVTSTDLFRVASVGSGITDNRVNYVLSIAGVAEEGYLESSPWENAELWSATSPISYVTGEEAPTLIQHGADDVVVPAANAHLLYTALSDMGAPAQLVLFDDTGHFVTRPKELRAWMLQNLDWFSRHLWREEPAGAGADN